MANVSKDFVLAGNSIFTIELSEEYREKNSLKPHYTFKVVHKEATKQWPEKWFVHFLTGPDNTKNYSYLGILNREIGKVETTPASKLPSNHILIKLLNRTLEVIWANDFQPMLANGFDVHHEGRCGRCGRLLTTPASIAFGIGPECLQKMGY